MFQEKKYHEDKVRKPAKSRGGPMHTEALNPKICVNLRNLRITSSSKKQALRQAQGREHVEGEPETRNQKPETRNLKPETKNPLPTRLPPHQSRVQFPRPDHNPLRGRHQRPLLAAHPAG